MRTYLIGMIVDKDVKYLTFYLSKVHHKWVEFIFKLSSAVCQSLLYYFGIPTKGFPRSSDGRESPCCVGDQGSVLMSGGSPGEGNGNILHYSSLENSMSHKVRHNWATNTHAHIRTDKFHGV